MNPEWLRYFVTLAETHNFHTAAERFPDIRAALNGFSARVGLGAH